MKLMKGISRTENGNDWRDGNEFGIIFATTNYDTALKYSEFDQDGEQSIAHFEISSMNLADLRDAKIAREIAEEYCELDEYTDDVDAMTELFLVAEDEIEIMEDEFMIEAIVRLGYEGAYQDDMFAIFAADAKITNVAMEEF